MYVCTCNFHLGLLEPKKAIVISIFPVVTISAFFCFFLYEYVFYIQIKVILHALYMYVAHHPNVYILLLLHFVPFKVMLFTCLLFYLHVLPCYL